MSHIRQKTTYKTEGAYGSIETKTVYVWKNNSCDVTSFYDDDGEFLFSIPDTIDGNLLDAINRLTGYNASGVITWGKAQIEQMTIEDREKCGI